MSTRSTVFMWENEDFDVHVYHELHDDAHHAEITLKCPDGSAKGQMTYSHLNFVVPNDWMDAIQRLSGGK